MKLLFTTSLSILLLLSGHDNNHVQSFTPPTSSSSLSSIIHTIHQQQTYQHHLITTQLKMSTDAEKKAKYDRLRQSYGEQSRKYRRRVYGANDWIKHRDPDRFFRNLTTIFESGILQSVYNEVSAVTAVALFAVAWNTLCLDGFTDFSGIHHDAILPLPSELKLTLPVQPFTLSGSALGLLLVFRTNTAYGRWNEARSIWGKIINHTRNVMRLSSSWLLTHSKEDISPQQRTEILDKLAKVTWAFPRSLTRHLLSPEEDEEAYQKDVREKFASIDPEVGEGLIEARHRPVRALFELSRAVDNLPIPSFRRVEIDRSCVVLIDQMGACERIFTTAVPQIYTRHTARILSFWLLLLPFALYEPFKDSWNHLAMIPASAAMAFFYFGIDELAIQLEEPFSVLAMHAFTNGSIGLPVEEYNQWYNEDFEDEVSTFQNEYDNLTHVKGSTTEKVVTSTNMVNGDDQSATTSMQNQGNSADDAMNAFAESLRSMTKKR